MVLAIYYWKVRLNRKTLPHPVDNIFGRVYILCYNKFIILIVINRLLLNDINILIGDEIK